MKGTSGVLDDFMEYSRNTVIQPRALSGAFAGEAAIANSNGLLEEAYKRDILKEGYERLECR